MKSFTSCHQFGYSKGVFFQPHSNCHRYNPTEPSAVSLPVALHAATGCSAVTIAAPGNEKHLHCGDITGKNGVFFITKQTPQHDTTCDPFWM